MVGGAGGGARSFFGRPGFRLIEKPNWFSTDCTGSFFLASVAAFLAALAAFFDGFTMVVVAVWYFSLLTVRSTTKVSIVNMLSFDSQ